jgi:hypothetical protein
LFHFPGFVAPFTRSYSIINFFFLIVQIVAQDLRDDLRDVAIEPDDLGWIEHLYQICQTAARVRRKMSNHADEWFFEPWDDAMLFPRVTANGQEMKGPQYN